MTLLPKWLREYADEVWEETRELSPSCLLMIGFAYEAATEIERLESENRRLKVPSPESKEPTMPDDLIGRLRSSASLTPFAQLLVEAANQIEALQMENHQQRALVRASGQELNRLRDQLSESS